MLRPACTDADAGLVLAERRDKGRPAGAIPPAQRGIQEVSRRINPSASLQKPLPGYIRRFRRLASGGILV